jgi:murein DD-endopeptidase MepM/ murein hydrolase activator NlpD
MAEEPVVYEPPVDALDDTNPSLSMQAVQLNEQDIPPRRRAAGAFSLLAAAGLTLASVFILVAPSATPPAPSPIAATFTPLPTDVAPTRIPSVNARPLVEEAEPLLPTLSVDGAALLLSTPPVPVESSPSGQIVRNPWDPFTIIPDRPRSEVETYTVVEGDTIFDIAERFGLKPETVVWCNDNRIIHGLRPGMEINISPVDGVCYRVIGDVNTVAQIAAQYSVTDFYAVIDADYNTLSGVTPDTVLPSGTFVVVPGGQREQISWNPPVEREAGSGGSSSAGGWISFASGEAGSCGRQPNDIGGTLWSNPLSSYTWVRGFTSWHTGVDLSASVGAPVHAANSGRVIFAGWNSWGYGYTVVLATGPFTTLYGHLSAIYVSCGQVISAGDVIAGVGSSGDSSGPHLHFEIRYLDVPSDPTATIAF